MSDRWRVRWGAVAIVALALAAAGATPAAAQTQKECEDAIAKLRAAIAATKEDSKKNAAQKGLRNAERELGEKDFDECVDWVETGMDALQPAAGGPKKAPPPNP